MSENKQTVFVPTIPIVYPRIERDYPISERENLMRALSHEKPLWMPCIYSAGNTTPRDGYGDIASDPIADSTDWFGVEFLYSEEQGSGTPQGNVMTEITQWRDKIVWPDFKDWDFKKGFEKFKPDENRATYIRLSYGLFERLHALEGFEQALVDLILEPEECKAFFERLVDHKIQVFKELNKIYNYDFVLYNDDWGTARAPFFSTDLLEQTLLEPTKRVIKAIQDEGVKVVFHNCGLIEEFIPYLVDEIHADALQIQPLNDTSKILQTYGDRVTVNYNKPDQEFLYDPATTPEQARAYAREIVDKYGAQANPGAGVIVTSYAYSEDVFYAFEDEIYRYSLELYKGL